jgi:dimethylargininase
MFFMLIGLTRAVSPNLPDCELTFIKRGPINYHLAVQQHDEYCAALTRRGVEVKTLPASITHPDSCFVEDTTIVLDEFAVITSMGIASRRGEIPAIEAELAKHRELTHIRLPATIEGGDVLRVKRTLFVGLSNRTNARGIEELTRILKPRGYTVHHVEMRDSLHLKSACTAIDEETLLVNPKGIDLAPFKKYKVLFTPDGEPDAANTLRVKDSVFLQAGFPKTAELVERHCERLETLDISEFRKAEAALTCLSIIFRSASQ